MYQPMTSSPLIGQPSSPAAVPTLAHLLLTAVTLALLVAAVAEGRDTAQPLTARQAEEFEVEFSPQIGAQAEAVRLEPHLRGCAADVVDSNPSAITASAGTDLPTFALTIGVRRSAPIGPSVCTLDWGPVSQEFTLRIEEPIP